MDKKAKAEAKRTRRVLRKQAVERGEDPINRDGDLLDDDDESETTDESET